jgi:hypothetical protein
MTAIIEEMEEAQTCAICRTRRPRRYCPGVGANICPVCCGTERERTVSCPLDCPYLRESRLRERDHIVDQGAYPNPDIQISEEFLASREALLVLTASGLAQAALSEAGSLDNDVKAALESLVQTYRTLESGLLYESRPENLIAARIQAGVQARIGEIEGALRENDVSLPQSDILRVLVFLQRLEIQKNNGRPRGRAFIDFLREFFPSEPPKPQQTTGLVLP